jgi:hypothetical protein
MAIGRGSRQGLSAGVGCILQSAIVYLHSALAFILNRYQLTSPNEKFPSISKGGVADTVGRGGLDSDTHSQIAPEAAPAAQPDI